ncbi:hypothetical protein T459_04321 [Capsicum annuum]|uniref:Uncharacterized protein n=1 Tax=Capsicum annuum TaxID=4072 RepID=A0A2G3A4R4_CAPAN|nr:hypothetical protein T459_04321 [Capsicum annuum]
MRRSTTEVKKSVEEKKPVADEALTLTTEEVKKVDEPPAPSPSTTHDEEKPQTEEIILATPAESEEKTVDKKIEPPTVEEVKKQDETPALGLNQRSEAGNVETLDKESKIEPAEEKTEQEATTVDIVETFEAIEKKKQQVHLETCEQQKAKEAEVSKAEPKEEDSELVPVVEEKLTEATKKE